MIKIPPKPRISPHYIQTAPTIISTKLLPTNYNQTRSRSDDFITSSSGFSVPILRFYTESHFLALYLSVTIGIDSKA
jgi:hypothetical protein